MTYRTPLRRIFSFILFAVNVSWATHSCYSQDGFRVLPYLQSPANDAITIKWFSETDAPGSVRVVHEVASYDFVSKPEIARSLAYNSLSEEPNGPHPGLPFGHRVRVKGLLPGERYTYEVKQGSETHKSHFRTAPSADQAIRLIAYSDSETEPESTTSPPVDWPPHRDGDRPEGRSRYFVNQTEAYTSNLEIISERKADLILIAGDLVETGGEQRDWDEFWRHNAGKLGSIASSTPLIPAIGNHENFAGGGGGGYSADGANFATAKYLSYFDVPSNGASEKQHLGRYYRLDYGPVVIITLDSSDGLPDKTSSDTNHNLVGSNAPDFNPGSQQYHWFEMQLAEAQRSCKFTIVQFHHTMFGSGPHSVPFGKPGFSGQSGIAMQVLLDVMHRHGVDLVLSGHNEMFERSEVPGVETLVDGTTRNRSIQCFDVGVGGDGLRGPSVEAINPFRKFLPHFDSREIWVDSTLQSGGKHYGHLEIDVAAGSNGKWTMGLVPVYCFPVTDNQGSVIRWERRTYPDQVVVTE